MDVRGRPVPPTLWRVLARMLAAVVLVSAGACGLSGTTPSEEAFDPASDPSDGRTVGLLRHDPGTSAGYTLFAPMASTDTYLIDNDGRVVHRWTSAYRPALGVGFCRRTFQQSCPLIFSEPTTWPFGQ